MSLAVQGWLLIFATMAETSKTVVDGERMMCAEGVADWLYEAEHAITLLQARSEALEALVCEIAADIKESAPACGMYEKIFDKLEAILKGDGQ